MPREHTEKDVQAVTEIAQSAFDDMLRRCQKLGIEIAHVAVVIDMKPFLPILAIPEHTDCILDMLETAQEALAAADDQSFRNPNGR